jgi:hypothetical protein
MAENRQLCPGIRSNVPGDPRDKAKVGLLEAQSPEGANLTPTGKMPETGTGPCGRILRMPAAILRDAGAMPRQGI